MKTYRKKMIYKTIKGNSFRKEKAIEIELLVLLSANTSNTEKNWKDFYSSLL